MASNAVSSETLTGGIQDQTADSAWFTSTVAVAASSLASLKLTVALFAMSIVIVLVGTLAQVDMDMWEVMDRYFLTWVAWIDFQVFFPRSWFPNWQNVPGGIWFPGGAAIGMAMVVNLIAAHSVRFKVQARGGRRYAGLGMLVLGVAFTWMVIASGHNQNGLQGEPPISWSTLWLCVKVGLVIASVGTLAGSFRLKSAAGQSRQIERRLLIGAATLMGLLATHLFMAGQGAYLGDAGMRILWQLFLATAAGLVLLAASITLFRKRAGIVTIHLGVGLLMLGQYWVAKHDVEEQMTIGEGETTSFARDIRQTELAIVDASSSSEEEVVVIPQWMLLASAQDESRSWLSRLEANGSAVSEGGSIEHAYLPFKVKVLEYYKNASLSDIEEGDKNLANKGTGLRFGVQPIRGGSGTDSSSGVDLAAAYVQFTAPSGDDLGTFMLSQIASSQDFSEQVEVDGKTYDVTLRFRRNYKPYSVTLVDARKDDYLGTDIPQNYSSDIRLVDDQRDTDRKIHIWMNNPLRYAGETFYQSGYSGPPDFPKESTTLSVVTNRRWMTPYVACMIVVVGLMAHFSGNLSRFLKRRSAASTTVAASAKEPAGIATAKKPPKGRPGATTNGKPKPLQVYPGGRAATLLPSAVVAIFAALFMWTTSSPRPEFDQMTIHQFGELPVIADGRVKPFDTLARNNLRVISNRYTFRARKATAELQEQWSEISQKLAKRYNHVSAEEIKKLDGDVKAAIELIAKGADQNVYRIEEYVDKLTTDRAPAIRWLLDVVTRPRAAEQHKVFRIDNLEVLGTLGLERRKSHLYSIDELRDGNAEFERQAEKARTRSRSSPEKLSSYERKLLELDSRIRTYTRLAASFQPPPLPVLPNQEDFEKDRSAAVEQIRRFQQVYLRFNQSIESIKPPLVVPRETEEGKHEWESYAQAWAAGYLDARLLGHEPPAALAAMNTILVAYEEGDAKRFNDEIETYQRTLLRNPPEQLKASQTALNRFIEARFVSFYGFEAAFNGASPFFFCWWPYLTAFVLSAFAWLGWSRPLNRAAFWLIAFTLIIHTLALIARIYISGRPPVTNLYSSAVFIGWAVVVFGLVLEWFYRNGIGNVVGAALGFASLVIAHNLAGDGDTFTVLQAVLDTQFWLALHVVTVTLGYATTFLAGFLGVYFIVRGVFTRLLIAENRKDIARMIYGTVCFALFFSFFGTVLGGLWADDSWGRFWGWDPKENGALMIVIWNALVLHARWGGMVKDRGLAVLAAGGNIVTAWSWFGVNELGVGLHSYGFTEGVRLYLALFAGTQLGLIAIGLLPKSIWMSYSDRSPPGGSAAEGT
jgi:ABC-type transport system involved in cytochrome c biogenesis permease subunit